jgi:hypothetical protein
MSTWCPSLAGGSLAAVSIAASTLRRRRPGTMPPANDAFTWSRLRPADYLAKPVVSALIGTEDWPANRSRLRSIASYMMRQWSDTSAIKVRLRLRARLARAALGHWLLERRHLCPADRAQVLVAALHLRGHGQCFLTIGIRAKPAAVRAGAYPTPLPVPAVKHAARCQREASV